MDTRPAASRARDAAQAEKAAKRLVAIGLLVLALICFTILDSSAKWLGHTMPPLEMSFFRYAVALVASVLVFNPLTKPGSWTTHRLRLQLVRALCLLGSTVFNFLALRHLQLAETMSINFGVPFMVALMAVPLLGETIGRQRWGAIAVGFVGVLLVTRPTPAHFDPAMGWACAGAACYATYVIITRMLSGIDSAASMLIYSSALPVLLLGPFMPAIWVWPANLLEASLAVALGLFGALGHFLLILAFGRAPASVLSPFIYTQIVWMVLSGWLVFGDVPGAWTLGGGAVVIASGLYLLIQERRSGRIIVPPAA